MTCPHLTNDTCEMCREYADFVQKVREMRYRQVEYFRSKGGLQTCKATEREVDRFISRILDRQGKLF